MVRELKHLLILGSGKMARNIGSLFLQKGYRVTWMASGDDRSSDMEKQIGKTVRRLVKAHGGDGEDYPRHFRVLGDECVEKPELIIECVQEDVKKKREVFGKIASLIDEQTILLTNSSSIMPDQIQDNVAGAHFFYPAELIDVVEVIVPSTFPSEAKQRIIRLLHEIGLQVMLQKGENAFVANRLLLPLESEMFRAMVAGYSPEDVNDCSVSALLPTRQLDFMDAVGLDIIAASLNNYVGRMAADEADSYMVLRSKLGEIVSSGKTGKKSNNGLLCGDRVIWCARQKQKGLSLGDRRELETKYLHLFINTCLSFVERERLSQASLHTLLTAVFQSEIRFFDALQKEGPARVYNTMETAYGETGLSYFKPSDLLGGAT